MASDLALQGHQLAVRTALARPQSDRFSFLVVHGTGLGKTVTVVNVAEDFLGPFRGRALVVAPEITHAQFVDQVLRARGSRYPTGDAATVSQRYETVTYESLHKTRPGDFDVLIFDEAHKLRSPDTDLAKTFADLRESLAPRRHLVLFLTATPMYDDADDIFPLLAFAAWNDGRKALATRLDRKDPLALADAARRYVSYSDARDPAHFPRQLPPPDGFLERVRARWAKDLPFPVLRVPTSKNHAALLDRVVAEHGELAAAPHVLVDWDPETAPRPGAKALEQLAAAAALRERAPKIAAALDAIERGPGPAIVYCTYVQRGAVPVAAALEARGYRRLTQTRPAMLPGGPAGGKRYAIVTSSRALADPTGAAVRAFAAGKLDVVLITQSAAEGLSFRGARQVHVLDTWWNASRILQVIGRGIRNGSHADLPPEDRDCRVFVYCATRDDGVETPDERHLRVAAAKYQQTEKYRKILRRHAQDCAAFADSPARECADPKTAFLRGSGEGVVRNLFDLMHTRVREWAQGADVGDTEDLGRLGARLAREDLGAETPAVREAFRLAVLASAFPRWVSDDRAILVDGDTLTVVTPAKGVIRTVDVTVADPLRHGRDRDSEISVDFLHDMTAAADGAPDHVVALAALGHVGATRMPALAETLSWVGDGELADLARALRRTRVLVPAPDGKGEILRDPFDTRGDGAWQVREHTLPARAEPVLDELRAGTAGEADGEDVPRGALRLDPAGGRGGLYLVTAGGTPGGREARTFPVRTQWEILSEVPGKKPKDYEAFRASGGRRLGAFLAALHAAGRLRAEVL